MPDLNIIMPVYNEDACIASVVQEWLSVFSRLEIEGTLHVYNDGSQDGTAAVLDNIDHPQLVVHHQTNKGHGPTILQGYQHCSDAAWLFQVDSDGELHSRDFDQLWQHRHDYDLVIGMRQDRSQPFIRQIISLTAALFVRVFFGTGVKDVNCPFRLMKTAAFTPAFSAIPTDTFAPNVILSGFANRRGLSILNVPVSFQNRTTGEVSLRRFRLLKAAFLSFIQTIKIVQRF